MEKHITSLEISKKLKELGVKQESYYYWKEYSKGWQMSYMSKENFEFVKSMEGKAAGGLIPKQICSAFLASELGELLPRTIEYQVAIGYRDCDLEIFKGLNGNWIVMYIDRPNDLVKSNTSDKSLPDAMGKMLIYLLENNLLAK